MSLLCASERLPSNAAARSCDHLASAYGNAVGHRDRERWYPSDNVGRGTGGRPVSAAGAGLALGGEEGGADRPRVTVTGSCWT